MAVIRPVKYGANRMNIMSNGSFLDEMNASNKQSELVKKLTASWEKKNSKVARAGGVSLMALTLAACGGSDDTPFSQVDVDAAVTAANAAAAAEAAAAATAAAASEAAAVAAAEATAAEAATAAATAAAASESAAVAAAEATAAEAATAAATAAAASEAAAVAAAEATATAAAEAAAAADIAAANAAKTTAEAASATAATAQAAAETAQAAAETAQATAEAARDVALADKATAETAQAAAETAKVAAEAAKVAAEAAKVAAENATAIAETAKTTAEEALTTLQTTYDALLVDYNALANPAASGLVLTSKADDVANGDANDNTITGTQATFDDTDTIKGGDGTDTLAITNTAAGKYAPAFMTSVEKIQMTSFANSSIDLVSSTGVTDVISLNSTAKDTFSNVQTLADIGVNGSSGDVTVTYKDSLMSGTTDEVNLALSGGADVGDVVIQGATGTNVVETVNITASGTSAVAVDSIVSNSAAIGTLDISGATDLTLGTGTAFGSGDILAVNIDASDMTGDLTVYADGADTNASIAGGSGNDTIYLDGVNTFFAADNGDAATNLVTSIVGGDGDDTLVIDASLVASQLVTSTADTADNVLSGIETISSVSAGAGGSTGQAGITVDASVSADVENVTMSLTNSTESGSTGNVYVGEITNVKAQAVSVTGAKGSHATAEVEQEITLYDGSAADTSAAITAAGDIKILTFNDAADDSDTSDTDESGAVEAITVTSGASDLVVDSLVAAGAFSATLAGAKDVTVTAADLGGTDTTDTATTNDLVTVNAADLTGDLDFTKSEAGVYSIKGGSGTNDIRLGSKGADTTVTGGAGADTVYLADTAGSAVADIALTTTGVETVVIDTISTGDDDFDMAGVSSSTVVKIVDAQQSAGFGVTLSNVGAQQIEIVTAEASSAAANATNDTTFAASGGAIVLGKATGATNTSVKLSGDAEGASSASSFDGKIETTGKLTIDSQIQTSAGAYLDTNIELVGAITELVLTGGGAQSDTTVANVDIKDASSAPVALASLDATAFTGDITATTAGVFASAATVALSTGDTSLTLATDQLARDASTITDAGGDDTLVFTAAAQGSTGTLSLRPDMTGVETISVKTTATSSHADGVVALNLVDTSGVTTIKTDGVGANDVTISNAGAVTSLVMGGGDDTVADDVSLDAATALTVENSAIVGKTNAGKLTVDGATSLVLEHGHASAINFTTLSADAATLIEIGGGLDGAGTTATEIVTLEADEVASLNLDASDGSVLVDNITADKLTKITISGDNAVTLGEDSSGNAGAVSTVKLAAVSGASATGAITLSGNMEYAANASVVTGTAADSVDLTSVVAAGVTVATGAGDDTITSNSAALRAVDGGADADDSDATTYDGGNDTLVITGTNNSGTGVVNLAATGDQVTTFNGVAEAVVQEGFESIDLSGLTSSGSYGFAITANAAGSTIVASGANDSITGGAGVDNITGGAGADTINGGADADIIYGGSGNDTITGGAGSDQFRFDANDGSDTVEDFTNGEDLIMLLDGASSNGTAVAFAGSTGTTAGAAMAATDLATFDHDGTTALVASHVNIADDSLTSTEIAAIDLAGATTYLMILNSTTGTAQLWYDSDWDDKTSGRVKVAEFNGTDMDTATEVAALTAADFGTFIM